jgi:CheY-like chemotaxis protein
MAYAGEEGELLELVDVSGIVKDMIELLKVSVSKHVSVETDLAGRLPAVRANPGQVRQVPMNLFYNASDAIGELVGVIRVTTMPVTVDASDFVQLEVSDTGKGIPPEMQSRIFDPYFTTKTTGSHGLGLATVRGIVERLNGVIKLSSTPGKGTTFHILLPAEEPGIATTEPAAASSWAGAFAPQGATILVVDDEEVLRHAVSKMLRKKGLCVLEASDGTIALNVIRARKGALDMLLLDITLPGASSREVYDEAMRLTPGLRVIVTSAKSQEIAAASLGVGIERFLRKPFSLDHLSDMVRQISNS